MPLSDRDYMQYGARRRSLRWDASVLASLLWANAIVFLLSGLGGDGGIITFLQLHPFFIKNYQVWRLVTYMFAHGGFMHLVFNMWGLFIFGQAVERQLGSTRFAALYFVSGVTGGLIWLLANWGLRTGGLVGASGAVFGVMIAAAMMFPNRVIVLLFPPIPMRLRTFVAIYAGIEVFAALRAGGGQIAHIAHLGGIAGGFVYMYAIGRTKGALKGLREHMRRRREEAGRKGFELVNDPEEEEDRFDGDLTAETDRILDKIGRRGLQSLTSQERRTLELARERLRDRH